MTSHATLATLSHSELTATMGKTAGGALVSRIEYAADQPPSFPARWTSRLAVFAMLLLFAAFFLHRLFALPTPVAINLTMLAFILAGIVLAMAAIAAIDIWMTGRQGVARVIFGSILATGIIAILPMLFVLSREWPELNDISTDTANAPSFVAAATLRTPGSNPLTYPGAAFASLQAAHYPDLKPLVVSRSVEEAFEVVLQALAKLRLKTLNEVPPSSEERQPGLVEVVDRTLVFGFYDDVAIRIDGGDDSARIDIRSASRYGTNDFGRNAERVRMLLKEIVARLEASAPNANRKPKAKPVEPDPKSLVKRPQGRNRPSADRRSGQSGGRPNARRAQEPTE
ncbi:MAG: DUF1499 domain-containing protein [Hyphomicrobium sp.]